MYYKALAPRMEHVQKGTFKFRIACEGKTKKILQRVRKENIS
jgi:hypothetical protein